MWGANWLIRKATGFSGRRQTREEREWARAQQRGLNIPDPRVYGPQYPLHGPRRYQSPPGRGTRGVHPPVRPWGLGRLRNSRGRHAVARNRENILRQEQERREHQNRMMHRNWGFERGTRLPWARPPYRRPLHHGGRRPIHTVPVPRIRPATIRRPGTARAPGMIRRPGMIPRSEVLDRTYLGRRFGPPAYYRRESRGRRGSLGSSSRVSVTDNPSDTDSFSDGEYSDRGSYHRVRSPGGSPGGRRGSFERGFAGAGPYGGGPYGGGPGPYGGHPYNGREYYHSDESFNVFPSISRESW